MKCPVDDPKTGMACRAQYCPPKNNGGNFSVSVCALAMSKSESSSKLERKYYGCEYTPEMCNYSCEDLPKNIASLPSGYPNKTLIGDILESTEQTRIYVGCVPGNFTYRNSNEFDYSSEIMNPPSISAGNQLTNSLLLPLVLIFILLFKIK